jgi:CBS-domain-containing membrane protein
MKVKDVYTGKPVSCGPDSSLASAAWAMWNHDCGIVPVVDSAGKLMGVVSDRDVTMAAVTKNRTPAEIHVREIMTGDVQSCHPQDDVLSALKTLAAHRIRRLPVVDGDGKLLGMLSLSDLVHHTQIPGTGSGEVPAKEVLATLKEVLTPWRDIRSKKSAEPFSRLGR